MSAVQGVLLWSACPVSFSDIPDVVEGGVVWFVSWRILNVAI